jgi:LCP family protein required for cell wall assembly
MGEWPDDWFRDGRAADGDGPPDGAAGAGASTDKTVSIPAPSPARGPGAAPPPGAWPSQPPASSARGEGSGAAYGSAGGYGPPGSGAAYGSGRGRSAPAPFPQRTGGPGLPGTSGAARWLRPRRIFAVLAIVIALLLAGTVGTYFYLNAKLNRSNILVDYPGRPALGSGTNWLIAGSDSRQGLTRAQERAYSTGRLAGSGRSDTILILHMPSGGGKPLLVSIPRDSYVDIPGHGMDKINAAFAIGGPALLAKTIQSNTGLYISHYMEIGFGGFVNVVNAVGGVRICVTHALRDQASGVRLHRGCQVLSGGDALAYVRDRHSFATQDLQREQDQRAFLKALLTKMTSPGVMFNPFSSLPAASGAVSNLTVDEGTSLYQLVQVAMGLSHAQTTTVPIANSNYVTSVGDAVLWNRSQARELFRALQNGQAVPKSLITGSHLGG